MTDQAKITSAEAIESFRAALLIYLSKARPTLEEMGDEARQTRAWLENDRRPYWMNEGRKRKRALEEAQQALFSAQLSSLGEPTAARQMAVSRAHRALRDAEEKLAIIHKWSRAFENLTAPPAKQLDQVHLMLTTDMKHATTYLARIVAAVDSYVQEAAAPQPATPMSASGESVENAPVADPAAHQVPNPAATPPTGVTPDLSLAQPAPAESEGQPKPDSLIIPAKPS